MRMSAPAFSTIGDFTVDLRAKLLSLDRHRSAVATTRYETSGGISRSPATVGDKEAQADAPSVRATRAVDFDLELGIWIETGHATGEPIPFGARTRALPDSAASTTGQLQICRSGTTPKV